MELARGWVISGVALSVMLLITCTSAGPRGDGRDHALPFQQKGFQAGPSATLPATRPIHTSLGDDQKPLPAARCIGQTPSQQLGVDQAMAPSIVTFGELSGRSREVHLAAPCAVWPSV